MVYSPVACMRVSSACWRGASLGCLPRSLPLRAGDGHAFAGAEPEQVDFEFGEGGQNVEEHLAHGVGGVVDGAAEGELDAAGDEGVADVRGHRGPSGRAGRAWARRGCRRSRTAARAWSRPGRARLVPVRPLSR